MSDIRRERTSLRPTLEPHRRISWGAIIAGTLLTLAIQFVLGLLGLGIGLTTLDPTNQSAPDVANFASVSGLWTIAVVLIGLLVGAFAAGRFAARPEALEAALHGVMTWALATLVVVYLLASGASSVLSGAFGAVGASIQGFGQAAASVNPRSLRDLPEPLRSQAEQLLRPSTPSTGQSTAGDTQSTGAAAAQPEPAQDPVEALSTLVDGVSETATPEERQKAVSLISQQAGIPEEQARQRLQQFQQQYDAAVQKARQLAADAADTVATASFVAFMALLLGLVVGALGGFLGRPSRSVS